MAAGIAIAEVEQAQGEESYRPAKPQRERVEFTAEQQEVFNRELKRARETGRRQGRQEFEAMRRDLFETVAVAEQLVERCKDRISVEEECAIRDGLRAIRKEYQEKVWPNQPK